MERFMTVINQENIIECINLNDVDFIETDKRKIVYHIGDKHYYQITTKSELDSFLVKEGFEILDRSNLVNVRKIRYCDEDLGKVYFTCESKDTSKYATVAKMKYKFVSNLIKYMIGENNNTSFEIKPKRSKTTRKLWGFLKR